MPSFPNVFVAVLVGGHGRRIGGIDKARLLYHDGETTLQRLVKAFAPCTHEVAICGRADQAGIEAHQRSLPDSRDHAGPMAGLESALAASKVDWCFLVAVDMVGVGVELLSLLAEARRPGVDAVTPRTSGGREPTCALYHRGLLRVVRQCLNERQYSLMRLLDSVNTCEVPLPDKLAERLINVNDIDDMRRADLRYPTHQSSGG